MRQVRHFCQMSRKPERLASGLVVSRSRTRFDVDVHDCSGPKASTVLSSTGAYTVAPS